MSTGTGGLSLPPGSQIMLSATTPGCNGDCLRHREGRVLLSPISRNSSSLDRADATWVVRAGLADPSKLSLESLNLPGNFLRHHHGELVLHYNDGDRQHALDATFDVSPGKNGQGISLSSPDFPSRFIRHYAGEVFLAARGGPEHWASATSWEDDVSWLARPPWTV
ncbi:MAG TPA: AbfB domain-containing protein [Mycobacteriales bacterium]|nr:AbfB domain-containing protein [Mycobacteriales bacterium]